MVIIIVVVVVVIVVVAVLVVLVVVVAALVVKVIMVLIMMFEEARDTAELVECDWTGAVMQKLPVKRKKSTCVIDQLTHQCTNIVA